MSQHFFLRVNSAWNSSPRHVPSCVATLRERVPARTARARCCFMSRDQVRAFQSTLRLIMVQVKTLRWVAFAQNSPSSACFETAHAFWLVCGRNHAVWWLKSREKVSLRCAINAGKIQGLFERPAATVLRNNWGGNCRNLKRGLVTWVPERKHEYQFCLRYV